jgi:hypothetical protein
MLPPPRELVLLARLALPAPDEPPNPPPLVREDEEGTLRLPTLSPPVDRLAPPEPRLELEPSPEPEPERDPDPRPLLAALVRAALCPAAP